MAVTQTEYRSEPGAGFPGQVANGETSNRISRTCEDAAGLPFGAACFDGAGDHGCTSDPAAPGAFLGIAMSDVGVQPLPGFVGGVGPDLYPLRSSVGIMTLGGIKVATVGAVAKRDPVYITPAKGFTNVAGGGANRAAPGWTYDATLAGAGVVRIVRR